MKVRLPAINDGVNEVTIIYPDKAVSRMQVDPFTTEVDVLIPKGVHESELTISVAWLGNDRVARSVEVIQEAKKKPEPKPAKPAKEEVAPAGDE